MLTQGQAVIEKSPQLRVHTKQDILVRIKKANKAYATGDLISSPTILAEMRERYGV